MNLQNVDGGFHLQHSTQMEKFRVQAPEKRVPFPYRLWEAVNDSEEIITWVANGRAITVDEERFEREAMIRYPGLVQIPSFANMRRQLRAYNFEWRLLESEQLIFYHPCFCRQEPAMLEHVYTRRCNDTPDKPEKRKASSEPSSPQRPASVPAMTTTCHDGGTPTGHQLQHSASVVTVSGTTDPTPLRPKRRYKRRRHPKSKTDLPIMTSLGWDGPGRTEGDGEVGARSGLGDDAVIVDDVDTHVTHDVRNDVIDDKTVTIEVINEVIDDVSNNATDGTTVQGSSTKETQQNCTCTPVNKASVGNPQEANGSLHPMNYASTVCVNHMCAYCNIRWVSQPVTTYRPYDITTEFGPKPQRSFYCYQQSPTTPKDYNCNPHMAGQPAYRLVTPMAQSVYQPVVMDTTSLTRPKSVYVSGEYQTPGDTTSTHTPSAESSYNHQAVPPGGTAVSSTSVRYETQDASNAGRQQPAESPKQYHTLESIASWYAPYQYQQYSQRYPEVHKALTTVYQPFPEPKQYTSAELTTHTQTMHSQENQRSGAISRSEVTFCAGSTSQMAPYTGPTPQMGYENPSATHSTMLCHTEPPGAVTPVSHPYPPTEQRPVFTLSTAPQCTPTWPPEYPEFQEEGGERGPGTTNNQTYEDISYEEIASPATQGLVIDEQNCT